MYCVLLRFGRCWFCDWYQIAVGLHDVETGNRPAEWNKFSEFPLTPSLVGWDTKGLPLHDQCDKFCHFGCYTVTQPCVTNRPCVCHSEKEARWFCCTLKHKHKHTSADLHPIIFPFPCVRQKGALLCPPIWARCDPDDGSFQRYRSSGARGLHGSAVIYHRAQTAES